MTRPPWRCQMGDGPVIATAIHAGHDLRPEVAGLVALDDAARLREEDPFTDSWAQQWPTWLVVDRSRWEVDVNRPRQRCVYLEPEDCWGLRPWRSAPPEELLAKSLRLYDEFYAQLEVICADLEQRFGAFVLMDLHSYNHRRLGPDGPAADPAENPVINVGTASMDRTRWSPLVDTFLRRLNEQGLDARENVRFRGAELARWTHRAFPESGCCLAVDVKKVFLDEYTGVLDAAALQQIGDALLSTLPDLSDAVSTTAR